MEDGPTRRNSSDLVHDVLAAEEFALPTADPSIGHPPVALPGDPSGIEEPHDVLAAEEFALPATPPHPMGAAGSARRGRRAAAYGAVAAAVVLWRRRRRGGAARSRRAGRRVGRSRRGS